MAEFRLSRRAEEKLVEIYAYSELKFGRYQTDAYAAGMERSFGLLADFPSIGTEVFHLAPMHWRYRFESHYIYYTEESYGLLIRDLFHVAQDIRASLFR